LPEARVYGISVSRPVARAQQNCAEIVHGAAERVGLPWRPEAGEMPIRGDWIGDGYGVPTASGLQVIQLAARLEGLLFDHVYTGKALAGLRGLAGQGELRSDEVVLFWHTGGTPALFAHPELYAAVN
ncbi:MAG: pyridoxal-phosphate dependent enzyme, partial [SAR202 cluster bacterium]|nr:pyridoxal-phosphate dependent enzyme [SAR202 cluster bacterium]